MPNGCAHVDQSSLQLITSHRHCLISQMCSRYVAVLNGGRAHIEVGALVLQNGGWKPASCWLQSPIGCSRSRTQEINVDRCWLLAEECGDGGAAAGVTST